jgi:hypothetical protein
LVSPYRPGFVAAARTLDRSRMAWQLACAGPAAVLLLEFGEAVE